jgi:hypothetical protein
MVKGYTPEIGVELEGYNIQPTLYVNGPFLSQWINPIGQSPKEGNWVHAGGNFAQEACNNGRRIVKWPGTFKWHRAAMGNVTDCIQWDNNGIPYCPEAPGATISVNYHEHELQQQCTYDKLPRDKLFTGYYDKYFDNTVLETAKDDYCSQWQNIGDSECIKRLENKKIYKQQVVDVCLENVPGQTHVAHQWPLMEEVIGTTSCKNAIITSVKNLPNAAITASGRITEYCNDSQVAGDTLKVKGIFDPACSCVNMLNPNLDCTPYSAACQPGVAAGIFDVPGCPAGCVEKIKRDQMFSTAATDPFVAQVKNFFDTSVGGPYCFSQSCQAGNKDVFLTSTYSGCNMNIQACFINAVGNKLDNSSITPSCQMDMNITDTTECEYSSWEWSPCVNNSQTGTRKMTHQPSGQICDKLATTQYCGDTNATGGDDGNNHQSGSGVTPDGGVPGSPPSRFGIGNFWLIVGLILAVILISFGVVVFW